MRTLRGASVGAAEENGIIAAVVRGSGSDLLGERGDGIGTTQRDGDGLLLVLLVSAVSRERAAEISLLILDHNSHGGVGHIIQTHLRVGRVGVVQTQTSARRSTFTLLGDKENRSRFIGLLNRSRLIYLMLRLHALVATFKVLRNVDRVTTEIVVQTTS